MHNWELTAKRQSVGAWRDRQILAAAFLLNTQAQVARASFEGSLSDAGLYDSVWDPAGFAHARIDALMRASLPGPLSAFRAEAAAELRALDPRFATLAEAIARYDAIEFPEAPQNAGDASRSDGDAAPATIDKAVSPPADDSASAQGWWIAQLPGKLADQVRSAIFQAGDVGARLLQDKVGLYERLRDAAAERIRTQWMGDVGEPRPVLGQIIAIIDEVSHSARTSLS